MKKIALIGGARPNFMKLAPLYHEFQKRNIPFVLINAGQHIDPAMSTEFFAEFGIKPDYTLTPSRKNSSVQMDDITSGLSRIFKELLPAVVVVVGDVNATLAGARAAHALCIPVAHVEAGLRSFNPKMQEEHNRIEIDRLSSLLFATEASGVENLKQEAITAGVHLVGNIMLDMVRLFEFKLNPPHQGTFYFVTLHRAENVDTKDVFSGILDALETIAKDASLFLPLHPRTQKQADAFGLSLRLSRIFKILPPLSYTETLSYEKYATLILTDSGGIQEEASFLGTPCITLRTETERPSTLSGTNVIGGITPAPILAAYENYKQQGFPKKKVVIPYADGKVAERITDVLETVL